MQTTGISLALILPPSVCIGLILVASVHDIATRTIPNGLALLLAIAGIATGITTGHLFGSAAAATGVFVVASACWRCGWMGGGDVKLLGAAALGIPASSMFTFVAAVAIAGGGLALFYLATRRLIPFSTSLRPHSLFARAVRVERRRLSQGGPLPYACAIAAGVLFVNITVGTV